MRPGRASTLTLITSSSIRAGRYRLRISATTITLRHRRLRGRVGQAHAAGLASSTGRHTQAIIRTRRTISLALAVTPAGPAAGPTDVPSGAQQIPSHIETWAYDDGCNGGTGASADVVRNWLTYAESNCGPNATKALSDCNTSGVTSCTAIQYLDANKIYSQGSVPIAAQSQETWWLHQPGYSDAGHRVSFSGYGGGNILDQANPDVRSWFENYARTNFDSYNGLMMDDTSAGLSDQLYGSGFSSSQELPSNQALQAAHEQMARAVTHTSGAPFMQVDNGLNVNPNLPTPFPLLDAQSGVVGVIAEGAPVSDGTMTSYYSTLLDDMSHIDSQPHEFLALLSYDSSSSLTSRRVQAATVLLGYSPGHTVSWSDLESNSSNLAVWPEEGIYPTDPVQTMAPAAGSGCFAGNGQVCSRGGHNDVEVAPGVYRREFGQCFNAGAAIGPCAAIVNDTGSSVTVERAWLTQTYAHEVTMSGSDVQSGGTISVTGAAFTPGSTTIAGHDGALLAS